MKFTRVVGSFVAGTTLAVAAFGSAAGADTADDVQQVVENVPAAVERIPPALQAVFDTYSASGSFEDTTFTAISESLQVSLELVQGTEQFALLPLGFALVAQGAYDVVLPYVRAIDDPSTAGDLVNPDDVTTILSQLPDAVDPLSENVTIAVVEGLQGNLIAGEGLFAGGTPAVVGNVVAGTASALAITLEGTNYAPVATAYQFTTLVAAIATGGYVQDAEDNLAPIFEALSPVTGPIVDVLAGD